MPYRIDVSATSSAPPEIVFDHLAKAVTWADWGGFPFKSIRERAGAADPDGIGSIRRAGRFREEVVAFDPPAHYAYTMLAGAPLKDYRADVTLGSAAGGTAIRWEARFERRIPGTGALLRAAFTLLLRRLARGLARHADRCETGCAAHRAA
ncbi:SRPBCC family protein [Actinomadura sp. HBU206391]|uniref:SRPBCC family protein n=1 Tax=Actinomadura sp. HBU206391 TaxID=2731692 RepID=UPI00164F44F4|nr:SRPBCC family protein [Actinomadura sp. HBU206391]MBC6456941.1 SRPBCC family protein [Actinomadura sp. HBU206391]